MRRLLLALTAALVSAFVLLQPLSVSTQETATSSSADKLIKFWAKDYAIPDEWKNLLNTYTYKVVAKARPDECYSGLSFPDENRADFSQHYPKDLSKGEIKSCLDRGLRLKVNQSYIWGMTKAGGRIWFGTAANNVCRAPVSLFGGPMPPYETDSWVCHGGAGDARPPRMFIYDPSSGRLTDLTPKIIDGGDLPRLQTTVGIRSAGSFGDVVFFGGVSVDNPQGEPADIYTVIMFAFNAKTQEYLGSYKFDGTNPAYPWFTNMREWVVANDQLYVGVNTTTNPYLGFSGRVLRWTGTPDDPFQFQTVGNLSADPAYLVEYKGRLVSSTWGGDTLGGFVLYMSPEFGDDGMLTGDDASEWTIKWRISEYEPEPAAAAVQTGGAIAVEGDALIWGTLHAPTSGWLAYRFMYRNAPTDVPGLFAAFFGTYRPISLFRAYNLEDPDPANRRVDLLYGSPYLPKFDSVTNQWNIVPNNMGGAMPLMGPIGMGNFFNAYTWWMENYHGRLYVGTFDHLYVAPRIIKALVSLTGVSLPEFPKEIVKLARHFEGADVWMFASDNTPAVPVTLSGAGNMTNYGIRTMVTLKDTLYLGGANSMNLLTAGQYQGGFELIKVVVPGSKQ